MFIFVRYIKIQYRCSPFLGRVLYYPIPHSNEHRLHIVILAHGPGREAPRGRGPYGNMGTGQRSSLPHSAQLEKSVSELSSCHFHANCPCATMWNCGGKPFSLTRSLLTIFLCAFRMIKLTIIAHVNRLRYSITYRRNLFLMGTQCIEYIF